MRFNLIEIGKQLALSWRARNGTPPPRLVRIELGFAGCEDFGVAERSSGC